MHVSVRSRACSSAPVPTAGRLKAALAATPISVEFCEQLRCDGVGLRMQISSRGSGTSAASALRNVADHNRKKPRVVLGDRAIVGRADIPNERVGQIRGCSEVVGKGRRAKIF